MGDERLSEFSDICDLNIKENEEKCVEKFLKILEIDYCKFENDLPLKEACPSLLRDEATQTETEFVNATPPWVVYLENKINIICKELSELLKSSERSNECKDQQNAWAFPFNYNNLEDSEIKYNNGAVAQIEDKIEASLKMVLELKNSISVQSVKEKICQTRLPTIHNDLSLKDSPKNVHAINRNLLKVNPIKIYKDEVFPRSQNIPSQMSFQIFNDSDQKCSQIAKAVVFPTRSGAVLSNNISERYRIHSSTTKDSMQMKTRESLATNQLQEIKLQKNNDPTSKDVSSYDKQKYSSKKRQNQSKPQRPAWR